MLHEDGRARVERFRALTTPFERHVWQRDGSPGRSPFFFAWNGVKRADRTREALPAVGLASERAFAAVRSRGVTARLSLAAAKARWDDEADDEDDAILSISRTALFDRSRRESHPARYVDTAEIPFLTLSIHKTFRATGVALGDLATVIHARTGRMAHAIVGDGRHITGAEPSLHLAELLDLSPGDEAVYLIHPRSGVGQGTIPTNAQIDARGDRLFRLPPVNSSVAWDAILADCFPDLLATRTFQRVC